MSLLDIFKRTPNEAFIALQAKVDRLERENKELSKAINMQATLIGTSVKALKSAHSTIKGTVALRTRIEELEMVTEASVPIIHKHERHLAGLWAWRAQAMKDLEAMKGTT